MAGRYPASGASSGLKTATGAILAQPGFLVSAQAIGDGTNDDTLILYDDPDSAHGTELCVLMVSPEAPYASFEPSAPIRAALGIWAVESTNLAGYIVHFRIG